MSQSGLSFERLVSFCQVAEAGGVAKAARGDPVRQSQFSRQIKELQEFFGVPLVRRVGRGSALTEAGVELYRLAREQLSSLADFRMAATRRPLSLTVAAGESVLQWLVMARLPALSKRLPEVRFRFLNLPTKEAAGRLREGTVDLALVRADGGIDAFNSLPLGKLRFSWFVPGPLLPTRKPPSRRFKALAALPLAALEGRGRHREQLAGLAEQAGVTLNLRLELPSFPLVAQAVRSGSCAGILPTIAADELLSTGVVECRPAGFERLTRKMALVWSARNAGIRTVVSHAATTLAEVWRMP